MRIRAIECGQVVYQTVDNLPNSVISHAYNTHRYTRFSTPRVCGKSGLLTNFKEVENDRF